jgi:hypothetical protein
VYVDASRHTFHRAVIEDRLVELAYCADKSMQEVNTLLQGSTFVSGWYHVLKTGGKTSNVILDEGTPKVTDLYAILLSTWVASTLHA